MYLVRNNSGIVGRLVMCYVRSPVYLSLFELEFLLGETEFLLQPSVSLHYHLWLWLLRWQTRHKILTLIAFV